MVKMSRGFWNCRMSCIVTGASRGLGRSIAIGFSQNAKPGSIFLLLARDKEGLEETKTLMLANNDTVNIMAKALDLSKPNAESYHEILVGWMENFNVKSCEFDRSILVHNAGSLGDLTKNAQSFVNINELRTYLDLNLNSVIILTSIFLQLFKANMLIVNITSLAALKAFKGWYLYCTGKAARDAYFRVLAEEENLSVLSYAPGPLETDMVDEIVTTASQEHKEWFTKARLEGKLLACDTTVTKLMAIVESGKYKSGDHVDVYDEL